MIFDIPPYHHRKCEELALKKIFVNYTFSGRYLVVGRGEKKQDITLVWYEYNKKCISYFYNWISTTCRDIQTAIIKTCAYNNRFALKCAFGESYNDLYPGTIYSPPSYDVRFPSAIMSSWYYLFTFIGIFDYENINTLVWDRLFQLFYSFEE